MEESTLSLACFPPSSGRKGAVGSERLARSPACQGRVRVHGRSWGHSWPRFPLHITTLLMLLLAFPLSLLSTNYLPGVTSVENVRRWQQSRNLSFPREAKKPVFNALIGP